MHKQGEKLKAMEAALHEAKEEFASQVDTYREYCADLLTLNDMVDREATAAGVATHNDIPEGLQKNRMSHQRRIQKGMCRSAVWAGQISRMARSSVRK